MFGSPAFPCTRSWEILPAPMHADLPCRAAMPTTRPAASRTTPATREAAARRSSTTQAASAATAQAAAGGSDERRLGLSGGLRAAGTAHPVAGKLMGRAPAVEPDTLSAGRAGGSGPAPSRHTPGLA